MYLDKYAPAPVGHKNIRFRLEYDVNHDRCHKARLVADGHITSISDEIVYSGGFTLRGIRILV